MPPPVATNSAFRRSLFDPEQFTLTFELVPSRGGHSKGHTRLMELARAAAADGRLQAVSITENAGGHPALSPEVLGQEIQALGLEVINHFSCKDKNRNQMESLLFGWDRQGLHNLLVLTGDYPQDGYQGRPKPVFDLDSVQVLDLVSQMNRGHIEASSPKAALEFTPTSFLKGVAVSPFKRLESELFLQYAKLHRKALAGADYIITQLGYDARKYHEVLLYLRLNNLNLPVLGNVFIPNLTVARLMHQGEIPGCIISDELYAQILAEAEGPDKGKKARLIRAAKLLAILQGLGFAGAHIGGPGLTFSDLDFVITLSQELAPHWQEYVPELSYWPADGAYYFEKDPATGLNLPTPRLTPGSQPGPVGSLRPVPCRPPPLFRARRGRVPVGQEGVPGDGQGRPRPPSDAHRIPDQAPPLRLPELRRLPARGPGLPLPPVRLRQIPPERRLRRQSERLVRGLSGTKALFLCPPLRTAQALRSHRVAERGHPPAPGLVAPQHLLVAELFQGP